MHSPVPIYKSLIVTQSGAQLETELGSTQFLSVSLFYTSLVTQVLVWTDIGSSLYNHIDNTKVFHTCQWHRDVLSNFVRIFLYFREEKREALIEKNPKISYILLGWFSGIRQDDQVLFVLSGKMGRPSNLPFLASVTSSHTKCPVNFFFSYECSSLCYIQ